MLIENVYFTFNEFKYQNIPTYVVYFPVSKILLFKKINNCSASF